MTPPRPKQLRCGSGSRRRRASKTSGRKSSRWLALARFQAKRKQELDDGQMAVELHKKEVQLANQGGGSNFPVTESSRAVDEGGDGDCLFHVFRALHAPEARWCEERASKVPR